MNLLLVAIVTFGSCLQIGDADDQCQSQYLIEAVRQQNIEILRWLINQGAYVNVQDKEGMTPLMFASLILDKTDMIEELLTVGADPEIKEVEGKTALHFAVEIGGEDAVKILFGRMNNTNITDNKGRSALHYAVMSDVDNTNVLSYLVDRGMDCYKRDAFGLSSIHTAALIGKISALKTFANKEMDLNLATADGSTPLILSSLLGKYEAAKFLIDFGVNLDTKDNKGLTALHAAAFSGNLELVKIIAKMSPTLNDTNLEGRTPLHIAVDQGHYAVSEYLVGKGSTTVTSDKYGNTLLHLAAKSGNLRLLELLLIKNFKLEETNQNGRTPLVMAVAEGHEDATKLLIKKGADTRVIKKLGLPFLLQMVSTNNTNTLKCVKDIDEDFVHNISDSRGATLLHHGSKNTSDEMVKYILELMVTDYIKHKELNFQKQKINRFCLQCYVSVTNMRDVDGKTPLYYAVEGGNTEVIDILLDNGANQSIADNSGVNPFHVAASLNLIDILMKLTLYNNNINTVDEDGKTALYHSAESGKIDSLKYLINFGADTTIKDSRGRSLLHAASASGNLSVVQEIIKHDQLKLTDINIKDNEGKTPAWYALNNGNFDILTELEGLGAQIEEYDICQYLESGNLDIFRHYISNDKKFVLNNCFSSKTLFHIAASKGFVDVIKALKHSNQFLTMINKADDEGKTPLWYAINGENWDCATELEQAGGEIIPEVTIKTATYENMISFVKYFVKKGADIGPESENGWPIISDAAYYGHNDIINFLLDSGADIDQLVPSTKRSALHMAAMQDRCSTIELLLSRGALRDRIDTNKKTPYDYAQGCSDVLQKYGAKHGHNL